MAALRLRPLDPPSAQLRVLDHSARVLLRGASAARWRPGIEPAQGKADVFDQCRLVFDPMRGGTDAEREWAYDRQSDIGKLDKALDEAPKAGWIVVDMKQAWKIIYPFQK